MFSKANLKLSYMSVATLLISSGVHMRLNDIEPTASSFAIWSGIIFVLALGIVLIVERVEKDYERFRK